MKNSITFKLGLLTLITCLVVESQNLRAQSTLPDFKAMMIQGVPYDSIKTVTEAVMVTYPDTGIEEGGELNKYKRWVNYWDSRAYLSGSSIGDISLYSQEINKYYNMYSCNATNTPKWEFLGPTDIRDDLNNPICVMGRVNAVAMHPSNLNVMYAGSSSGGVWKTINAQDSMPNWLNISDGYGFDNIGVTDITINPLNPNKIYVATAHVSYGYGIGVMMSNDGGDSWEKSTLQYFNGESNGDPIYQIRVDHIDTNKVYGLYSDSVITSNDAGLTWQNTGLPIRTGGLGLTDIELNKLDPSIVYVGGKEVWRKEGNNNWVRLDNLPSFNVVLPTGVNVLDRNFHISADSLGLYCLVQTLTDDTAQYGNNRKHWFRYIESQNKWVFKRGGTHYCEGIVVSSVDTNIIYYWDIEGRRQVGKSVDEAATFENQSNRQPYSLYNSSVSEHMDIRDFQFVEGTPGGFNDVIIFGTDGGVTFSKRSKTNKNEVIRENKTGLGLNITELYGVTSVKFEPEFVSVGAQDNSTFTFLNDSWNHLKRNTIGKPLAGDAYDGFITSDHKIYAQREYPFSVLSLDSGVKYLRPNRYVTFTGTANNSIRGNGFVRNPSFWNARKRPTFITKKGDVYIGRYDLAKKVKDDSNYIFISDFHSLKVIHNFALVDVSVYEQNDDIIFAAFPKGTGTDSILSRKIFRTVNGGVSWTDISNSTFISAGVLQWHGVKSLVVDPKNPNKLWVTLDGMGMDNPNSITGIKRVVWTQNALDPVPTWTDFSEGLPVFPMEEILYDEGSNGRLYVACDVGVFYRNAYDTNAQWECFNNGIPDITVSDIDVNYCNRKIYAATHGRGLWSADLLPPNHATAYVGSVNGEIWNNDTTMKQNIHISSAYKLIINANVNMIAGTKIIVDQGAELVLNGATITNECGAFWKGIEVWGNSEFSVNSQFCPNGTSCLVGKLTMNNSTIENAENAVNLWKPNDWDMVGGMIFANSSVFKNNRRDVVFMAYENHYNFGPFSGNVAPYQSRFNDCKFVIDNNFLLSQKTPFPAKVTLWRVRGVVFNGCEFKNSADNIHTVDGIYSIDANYSVQEYCNNIYPCAQPTLSTFTGLRAGISALSTGLGYSFLVDTAVFSNNTFGIIAVGVDQAVITRNYFTYNNPNISINPTGIVLENADQFRVEENIMKNNSDRLFIGIYTKSSGGNHNMIYKNAFENVFIGNLAYHDNNDINDPKKGLQYRCNLNKNSGMSDFSIFGGSGIAKNQGSDTLAADNTFTTGNASIYYPYPQISNGGNSTLINYYHHTNTGNYVLEPTDVTPYKVKTQLSTGQFNASNNCLSKLSYFVNEVRGRMEGGKIIEIHNNYNDALAGFNQAHYVYVSTIDGGDTYGLLNTVQNTNAQEAWEYRTDLINSSPLSLGVVFEVIEQNFLSNVLLLDVLMVNPHAAREEEVIHFLETKPQPMPAYMINTFLGIFEVQTQKDVLEAKMGVEQNAVNQNAQMLIAHWYADTTGTDLDSIPALLTSMNTPYADLYKVAYYTGFENNDSAQAILAMLPEKFVLSESEYEYFDRLMNYYQIKSQITSQGDSASFNLDSGAKSSLQSLADDSLTKTGRYAKGWLKFTNNELYWPYLPMFQESGNKKEQQSVFEKREEEKFSLVKVYPNPAKQYFTVTLNLQEPNSDVELTLINSMGQVVLFKQISGASNHSIATENLPSGMYILVVKTNREEIHKQTLEIIH